MIDRARPKLGVLEAGRAIAALAVVAHHAALSSDAFTSQTELAWLHYGILGVDFFFVLSGFIIYHTHRLDARNIEAATKYFRKRVLRIFVPYLPVSIALIALYLCFPGVSQGGRDWSLITSLTLIPLGGPPALSVAWTLSFEMLFYIVFLAFFFTRHVWWIIGCWAAATIGANVLLEPTAIPFVLDLLILEFVAGMLAAAALTRIHKDSWPFLIGLGAAGCVAYFYTGGHRVFFGLSLSPLVLGLVLAELRYGFRLPGTVLHLGAASYAIYLVHNPLQSLVARIVRPMDDWMLTFTACVIGGVLLGLIYHAVFEKPVLRALSKRPLPSSGNLAHERSR